jgi:hypothetical protein
LHEVFELGSTSTDDAVRQYADAARQAGPARSRAQFSSSNSCVHAGIQTM